MANKRADRHLTTVYFADDVFNAIKQRADALDISVSAMLRLIVTDWLQAQAQKKEG